MLSPVESTDLVEQFQEELPPFLREIGIATAIFSEHEGLRIVIPKSMPSGFTISFDVYGHGIYPAVEGLDLIPLDVMATFELTWCKRFLLSALSKESELTVRYHAGKPFHWSLRYFDPWTRAMETHSEPKFFYPFWRKGETRIFQNRDVNLDDSGLASLIREVDAAVLRGQTL